MRVLVIDPPWPQTKGGLRKVRPNQGRQLDYQTLTVDEIFELLDREFNLGEAQDNVVFLWAIDKFLWHAEKEMVDRGYKLHARLIWDKENGIAPAFTIRYTHEYLLWFYKSPFQPVAQNVRGKFPTIIREASREHSRKPDAAYNLIASLYPDADKWDIFSRESRDGWTTWGDQRDYFDAA